MNILKIKCCYNGYINKDEIRGINLANKDFSCSDHVIKQHTNDKRFIPWIEKLEPDLHVLYINVPC